MLFCRPKRHGPGRGGLGDFRAKSRVWAARAGAGARALAARLPRPRLPHPWNSPRFPWLFLALAVLFGLNHLVFLRVYVPPVDQGLESIRENGKLVVLTRLGPVSWYEGVDGLTGFEYEAMRAFGRSLGVEVEFRIYSTEQRLVRALALRKGHLAAAGLALDAARGEAFAAGPAYATTRLIVACSRQLVEMPRKIEDLAGLRFAAAAGSPGAALLADAGLEKTYVTENTEVLLARVAEGSLDCALSDARIFRVVNPYHPELAQAFELTGIFRSPGSSRRAPKSSPNSSAAGMPAPSRPASSRRWSAVFSVSCRVSTMSICAPSSAPSATGCPTGKSSCAAPRARMAFPGNYLRRLPGRNRIGTPRPSAPPACAAS